MIIVFVGKENNGHRKSVPREKQIGSHLIQKSWDTDSNKSTDFLLNPVLYIIYACLYM